MFTELITCTHLFKSFHPAPNTEFSIKLSWKLWDLVQTDRQV